MLRQLSVGKLGVTLAALIGVNGFVSAASADLRRMATSAVSVQNEVGRQQPKPIDPYDVPDYFSLDSNKVYLFAADAVSDYGGMMLDPEHFLLALIQVSPSTVTRFAKVESTTAALHEKIVTMP
jgi:hypothetical protein